MALLQDELAARIAPVVRANLTTHYPYYDLCVAEEGAPPYDAIAAHPAFGNSFDWHSSVHSHWTAIGTIERLRERETDASLWLPLEEALVRNLEPGRVDAEIAYLAAHPSYERPYGWAWALALAAAAQRSPRPALHGCAPQLSRMAAAIAARAVDWLKMQALPVRHGVHSNTAFALGLMLEASGTLGYVELANAVAARACEWFACDRDWPHRWERSGHDFLSPGLAQADLLRAVLPGEAFAAWWRAFLPALDERSPILAVAEVPRVEDGHIVHLHGLNLSRAGALARIGRALGDPMLRDRARALYGASVERAIHGHYTETHWLPTFAWDAAAAIDAPL